jgi:hypothetical protein
MKNNLKLYILSENIAFANNTKWICDVFKEEFENELVHIELATHITITNTLNDADICWVLAPWNLKQSNIELKSFTNKIVITTIHHIDWEKYDYFIGYFNYVDTVTTFYHVICPKVEKDLRKITNKKIIQANFWINKKNFIINSATDTQFNLREKYKIPSHNFVVGSFQRDTEGKDKCTKPKLSKGPDIFVKIVTNMKLEGKNPFVLLTGRRRNYVINELKKNNISYLYLEMVSQQDLNELYQCLDLYIVSSRVEGGPRAILECGIMKVPIISTDVGISELILDQKSIYDMNNYMSYKNAVPDINYAYQKSQYYEITSYLPNFINDVFLSS